MQGTSTMLRTMLRTAATASRTTLAPSSLPHTLPVGVACSFSSLMGRVSELHTRTPCQCRGQCRGQCPTHMNHRVPTPTTTATATTTFTRMFSAAAAETAEEATPEEEWKSMATRDHATAQHRNIHISPRKLHEMILPLRGLSADEAMIQMRLSEKKKAVLVEACIRNACVHAVNNYNMDRSRLVVDLIYANKGRYLKRLNMHAKGKTGIRFKYHSHLKVRLTEQPPEAGEIRLGKHGRRTTTIKNTLANMEKFKKFKEEEAERTKDQYM